MPWGLVRANSACAERSTKVHYKTVKVGELDIFYREAGPQDAPGATPAALAFDQLANVSQFDPELADKYHLVAPDYPGFGHSSMPAHDKFQYTFDNLAKVIDDFTTKIGIKKYAIYCRTTAPRSGTGWLPNIPTASRPSWSKTGNAYDEGLDNDFWKPIKAY